MASIDFGISQIRSGVTILALVENAELARLMGDASKEFSRIQSGDSASGVRVDRGGVEEEAENAPLPQALEPIRPPGAPAKGGRQNR